MITAHQHAPLDRLFSSQIATLSTRDLRSRAGNRRRTIIWGGGLGLLVLSTALAAGAVWKQTGAGASAQFHRGHLARLSAPRNTSEFSSVVELVEAVEPAVVQIETKLGLGSGFVLDASGLVVTCQHCIGDQREATIVFADGRREHMVRMYAQAPERDLAIIQISRLRPVVALPVASREMKKGEPVVAFGAPEGLSFSVSEGSISAMRTSADLVEVLRGPEYENMFHGNNILGFTSDVSLVQITAATMPGNSGGPVVDFSGNVIGICSFAMNLHGQHFGFCVSAREILRLVASMDEQDTTQGNL